MHASQLLKKQNVYNSGVMSQYFMTSSVSFTEPTADWLLNVPVFVQRPYIDFVPSQLVARFVVCMSKPLFHIQTLHIHVKLVLFMFIDLSDAIVVYYSDK